MSDATENDVDGRIVLDSTDLRDAAEACRRAAGATDDPDDEFVWSEVARKLEVLAETGEPLTTTVQHRADVANTEIVVQGHDEGITLQGIISNHDAAIGDLYERVRALEQTDE